MTQLAASVNSTEELWTVDTLPTAPYATVGSETVAIRAKFPSQTFSLTGQATLTQIRVDRGVGGTTAASHTNGSALTPVYGLGGGVGGGGVTVDNQTDPPAEVTTLIAPGAVIAGDEADLSDVVSISKATVSLNLAQIRALPTTAVTLIPAQGAETMILPIVASARFITTGNGFDGMDTGSLVLMRGGTYMSGLVPLGLMNGQTVDTTCPFPLPSVADGTGDFAGLPVGIPSPTASGINSPLVVKDDWNGVPDYTAGDAGDTLTITVWYGVLAV